MKNMNGNRRNLLCSVWFPAFIAGAMAIQANAQTCTAHATPKTVRAEGYTEYTADLLLTCVGGTPTAAGALVPQINVSIFLNTNATSTVTASEAWVAGQTMFSEALLLIDEPNAAENVDHRGQSHNILNCGNTGAPDVGPSGAGVCEIVSDGNPGDTYDGTQWMKGTVNCPIQVVNADTRRLVYGCGRPNVFQGRLASRTQLNEIVFVGVPFDPAGPGRSRTLRFTNIRANAMTFGPIIAAISISGGTNVIVTPSQVQLATLAQGLTASVPKPKTLRVEEGFANAWKPRNLGVSLVNSTYTAPNYNYTPGAENDRYSPTVFNLAQNVPGVNYSTEDGFQWVGALSGPSEPQPSPVNPPLGYGAGIASATGLALNNVYWVPPPNSINDPGIGISGESNFGTRIALHFLPAGGETITVPTVVNLYKASSPSGPASGVMVLIKPSALDVAGNGGFVPQPGATLSIGGGTVVYEVLYSDPADQEIADIPVTISGLGVSLVTPSFAPFYLASATPNPASAVPPGFTFLTAPRFNCGLTIANVPCMMSALLQML
jgi:hypothetical protein